MVSKLVHRMATDPEFFARLKADLAGTLQKEGFVLDQDSFKVLADFLGSNQPLDLFVNSEGDWVQAPWGNLGE